MIVGDILMFIPEGRINGQVWQNSMFYLVDDLALPLSEGEFPLLVEAFAGWYQTDVHANISSLVTSAMEFTQIYGENLFNVAELSAYLYSPPLIGAASGTAMAQYEAYGFTTPSQRRGMNSGQRRIPGVTETMVGNFGALEVSTYPALQLVADAFSADVHLEWGTSNEGTFKPVIVKRVRTGDGTPESPYEYRLPRTLAERVYYKANGWQYRLSTTTQNSRKTGRGI